MPRAKEIRIRRKAVLDQAEALYKAVYKEKRRGFTPAEQTRFNALLDKTDELLAEAERIEADEEAQEAADRTEEAQRARYDDEHTAIHESAHAIAALTTRTPFSRVTIDGQPGIYGDPDKATATLLLAAREAVWKWSGTRPAADRGAGDDLVRARKWAEAHRRYTEIGRESVESALETARQQARKIVEREWPAIQAVARRLLSSRSLDYAETRELALEFMTPESRRAVQGISPVHAF